MILKTLMAEISLTALKKERWSVMIAFLLITSVAPSRLIAQAIPSAVPFPGEDARKYHVISILHLFCNQDKVAGT